MSHSFLQTLKRCPCCGKEHTLKEWSMLSLVGDMKDAATHFEMRNCPCGSTISVPVVYEDEGSRFYASSVRSNEETS